MSVKRRRRAPTRRRLEQSAPVFAALGDIAEEIRIAVILRDLNELSYRDIGQIMDIPEGTAKSRVARGRAQLARKLVSRGIVGG